MKAGIARLQRISACLRLAVPAGKGGPIYLAPEDLEAHLDALDGIVHDGLSSDEALDLLSAKSERTHKTASAFLRRNAALRDLAATHYAALSEAEQARRLARDLARYRATAWASERLLAECPGHRIGTPSGYCWRILRALDRPISAERIRHVLAQRPAQGWSRAPSK